MAAGQRIKSGAALAPEEFVYDGLRCDPMGAVSVLRNYQPSTL